LTEPRLAGRALVSRRAVTEIVRRAAAGSYGVTGIGRGPLDRLRGRLRLGDPGIHVVTHPRLDVDLHLAVAYGVPVAEVAHNVESAVRYAVRQAVGREVDEVRIHVDGLRAGPGSAGTP
jgi:uncharacterized alkaline shock family protein YloU